MAEFRVKIGSLAEALRAATPPRPSSFPIHVKVGGHAFPGEDWDDFGVVVLGWWLQEAADLASDASNKAVFRFMDGPYELHFRPIEADCWEARGLARKQRVVEVFRETVPARSVLSELRRAAAAVVAAHRAAGIRSPDCETLNSYLA